MADEITRESHYVPQATLKRWSLDGLHVSAYRLLVSHPNVPEWDDLTIRGLARQRDLYTTFEGDAEGDDFEKFITREIEEPGQEAIERLLGNIKMKAAHWNAIAMFAVAQQMRTPQFFVEWVRGLNEQIPATFEKVLAELQEATPESLAARERGSSDNYMSDKLRIRMHPVPNSPGVAHVETQVSSSRSLWLAFMRQMLTQRTDRFTVHRWRLMKLAGGAEWPLTDHPLITLNWYGPGKFDFGAGWGRERSEFILPISPDLAVVTQIGSNERGPFCATPEQSRELQQIVVTRALRWIFTRKPAPWIAKFRPRVVDAEAFAIEQESWRTWNDMHRGAEAEFRGPRQPPSPV